MAQQQMVKVSLLQPMGYRAKKGDPVTRYPMGIVEMPLEHAQGLGVTRRIVNVEQVDDETVVERVPFDGAFDDKLNRTLTGAGFHTWDDLRNASHDQLMAVQGIGPAAMERIQAALG